MKKVQIEDAVYAAQFLAELTRQGITFEAHEVSGVLVISIQGF